MLKVNVEAIFLIPNNESMHQLNFENEYLIWIEHRMHYKQVEIQTLIKGVLCSFFLSQGFWWRIEPCIRTGLPQIKKGKKGMQAF